MSSNLIDFQEVEQEQESEAIDALAAPIFPAVPRKQLIAKVPSGEIRIELGADGAYLMFDCDCLHALPYCKAQCCALKGTTVDPDEYNEGKYEAEWADDLEVMVMKRDADGFCYALNRCTRTCEIYEDRPRTCQDFHCTRGANQRGWKLSNIVHRHSNR